MEAKEKAKELVEKYIYSMPILVHQTGEMVNEYAKELSKMTVNEIIEHGNLLSDSLLDGYIDSEFNFYWTEVLKEIDNI